MLSIARGVIERRRRYVVAEGPVVTDMRPDAPRHRLALGQDRHGRIVDFSAARTWRSISA